MYDGSGLVLLQGILDASVRNQPHYCNGEINHGWLSQDSVIHNYAKLPLHTRAVAERFDVNPSEYSNLYRIGEGVVGQVVLSISFR